MWVDELDDVTKLVIVVVIALLLFLPSDTRCQLLGGGKTATIVSWLDIMNTFTKALILVAIIFVLFIPNDTRRQLLGCAKQINQMDPLAAVAQLYTAPDAAAPAPAPPLVRPRA